MLSYPDKSIFFSSAGLSISVVYGRFFHKVNGQNQNQNAENAAPAGRRATYVRHVP